GLAEEDRAVAVGDLEPRVEGSGDVDQRQEELEPAAAGEEPLAPEVLHGAQPVDVSDDVLEPGGHALDVGRGPEIRRAVLGPEAAEHAVDRPLGPDERGPEDEEEERAPHWKSRERKDQRPTARASAR